MTDFSSPDAYGALVEPTTVKIQRLLPGPIERVWNYLMKDELRRQWLAAGVMEEKVGAQFELVWHHDDHDKGKRPPGVDAEKRMKSRITALDRPRKLAFEWEGTGDVSFELEPRGDEVLLTVTHRRLPTRGMMLGVSAGWHAHLDRLVAHARGTAPPPFWTSWSKLREDYDQRLPA